jgi:hypothetical protein
LPFFCGILKLSLRKASMSLLDSLRKGFRFFLMSFGISSPAKKLTSGSRAEQSPTKGK